MSEEEKAKLIQGLDKITVGINNVLEACRYLEGEFHFLNDIALYNALCLKLLDAEDLSRDLSIDMQDSEHVKG